MRRTKLVYANRNEDIEEKVKDTLKKYHIDEAKVIEVKYHDEGSRKNALIIYDV